MEEQMNSKYDPDNTKSLQSELETEIILEQSISASGINGLFKICNQHFFRSKLFDVTVEWSKKLDVRCSGICLSEGRKKCKILLNEQLLKTRPKEDLVQTLLHQMIHAYLFIRHRITDLDYHGAEFHKHMDRINNETGANITLHHDFCDQVKLHQQQLRKCNQSKVEDLNKSNASQSTGTLIQNSALTSSKEKELKKLEVTQSDSLNTTESSTLTNGDSTKTTILHVSNNDHDFTTSPEIELKTKNTSYDNEKTICFPNVPKSADDIYLATYRLEAMAADLENQIKELNNAIDGRIKS